MSDTLVGETRGLSRRPTYVQSVLLLHLSVIFHRMQLPDVLAAIRNLHAIDFDVDEYDIKGRLTCLTDKWGCPFLLVGTHSMCDVSMSLI